MKHKSIKEITRKPPAQPFKLNRIARKEKAWEKKAREEKAREEKEAKKLKNRILRFKNKFWSKLKDNVFITRVIFMLLVTAAFATSFKILLVRYIPDICIYDFKVLYPTSVASLIVNKVTGEYYDCLMGIKISDIEKNKSISEIKSDKLYMVDKGYSKDDDPMIESSKTRPGKRPREGSESPISNSPRYRWNRLFSPIPEQNPLDTTLGKNSNTNIPEPLVNTQAEQEAINIDSLPVIEQHRYQGIYNTVYNRSRSPAPIAHESERMPILNYLNKRGRELGFFSIDNISAKADSCDVRYFQNVPNINDTEKVELLKRFWQLFPYGPRGINTTLDKYTLIGRISHDLTTACDMDDWPYKSNQRKPADMSPFYDPNKPQGYYQPWASDIAKSLLLFKKNRGTGNIKPILDSDSQIFLTTFLSAHPDFHPHSSIGSAPSVLKKL